jgi:2-iminobutanoate/2-iminopropanoate deaminase
MADQLLERRPIMAPDAPDPVAQYSHAIRHGDLLFCSGQIPLRTDAPGLVNDSLTAEVRQCLDNLKKVCNAAGVDLSRALRMTLYTTNLDGFGEINAAYAEYFASEPPARSAVGVAALPFGARVEIDAIIAAR